MKAVMYRGIGQVAVEEIASDGETITANVKSIDDEMFGG